VSLRAAFLVHHCFLYNINGIFHLNILSKLFTFADDTKCFKKIIKNLDQQALQQDINQLLGWTFTSCLSFSPTKCVQLSFRATMNTTYYIDQDEIPELDSHRDLGIIISNNLSWKNHYSQISAKAYMYKILGLIHRIFKATYS